jgi:hypothetical protein
MALIFFVAFTLSIDTLATIRRAQVTSPRLISSQICMPLLRYRFYDLFALIPYSFNHFQQAISLYNFNMSSAAHAQLNALRVLFGNSHPIIVQARRDFFKSISDEDMHKIHQICLDQHVSRAAHQDAISALLDAATANEAKAESHYSSSSAAPAMPIGERTSIKRKRPESDEQRSESTLSSLESTPAQHHDHVYDLGSPDGIDDNLRDLMQAVKETPVAKVENPIPNVDISAPKTEKSIPQIEKLLCIPDKHGKSTYKSFLTLQSVFITHLQTMFDTDFLYTEGHRIECAVC